MHTLLRIAAIYSLVWAVGLACPALWPSAGGARTPETHSLALALAIANLAYAAFCWQAAGEPARHRLTLYVVLMVFGLRAAIGTYEVLYTLEGGAAVVRLVDMVLSLALFVGVLNALPGALAEPGAPPT